MTTYRLPDALGGGEYEEYRHVDGSTEAPAGAVAFLEAGCIFTVARRLLTEVKPPPPEPSEPRTLIWTGLKDGRGTSWEKSNSGGWWYAMGSEGQFTWAEVCAYGDPVRLVPDPFAEPVELPWESNPPAAPEDRIMRTSVRVLSEAVEDCNDAGCHGIAVHLDPAGARAKARALWAAADVVKARAGAR